MKCLRSRTAPTTALCMVAVFSTQPTRGDQPKTPSDASRPPAATTDAEPSVAIQAIVNPTARSAFLRQSLVESVGAEALALDAFPLARAALTGEAPSGGGGEAAIDEQALKAMDSAAFRTRLFTGVFIAGDANGDGLVDAIEHLNVSLLRRGGLLLGDSAWAGASAN